MPQITGLRDGPSLSNIRQHLLYLAKATCTQKAEHICDYFPAFAWCDKARCYVSTCTVLYCTILYTGGSDYETETETETETSTVQFLCARLSVVPSAVWPRLKPLCAVTMFPLPIHIACTV